MLREKMAEHGLAEDRLEVIEVKDGANAEELGFPGSPTILVGGGDIQPPGPQLPVGLTCRVYRCRDGRVSPLPDPEDISDALARMGA